MLWVWFFSHPGVLAHGIYSTVLIRNPLGHSFNSGKHFFTLNPNPGEGNTLCGKGKVPAPVEEETRIHCDSSSLIWKPIVTLCLQLDTISR